MKTDQITLVHLVFFILAILLFLIYMYDALSNLFAKVNLV